MTHPILYSFRRCPYAIRARLAILVSGLTCELREVNLADKPVDMVTASPKATIPVMVLADGTVLEESLDIMRFALGRHDPESLLSLVNPDTMALVTLMDDVFKPHLDGYKYPGKHEGDATAHRDAALAILADFNTRLGETSFLGGDHFSLIDAAIFPFVRQFAAVNEDWFAQQKIARVQTWLASLLAGPLFDRAMVTHKVWKPGDDVTLFGA